ncbi:hypothetical protein A3C26_03145 [Candidatus Daviesbacteria bacterium RIFCSPHIGHO2_02_FULL_39_12]|uniref:PIN domain-containing protein n=2 Tax=Candidatus Daviesiibacteriota TaxID=1752718 RepID=A0A1F5JE73_9BACT|nr:MAG: hypothetical protein A3C26_03145 [Candidatus Daviesbacteria bacterium RIFCSPHIGHO2_02_FULL_39_12]OGE71419.1 MAG: hypothetical protein A3H40_02735 [Candidatus Daviesbacteria bacterium RIFCSPLOWO2_02_FULL_38_15]
MKSVFLDSSVLFSAVNSPTGGSAKLFTFKNIQLAASPVVLAETERNVRKKLPKYHLERFFLLVEKLAIISQIPCQKLIKKTEKIIVKKDAVILAEAKQAKTDSLVTFDIKHFFTEPVANFLKPKKVYTPKLLIELFETKF